MVRSIEDVEVKPPQISEETKKSMLEFFMKTSIPRILADYKAEQVEKSKGGENLSCHYKKSKEE